MDSNLKNWLSENKINFNEIDEICFEIVDFGLFLHIKPNEDGKIFTESFSLIVSDFITETYDNVNYYCYSFGGNFYYEKKEDINSPKLNILKYLGKANAELNEEFPYLGIHGKYELLNGSRDYKDWCKKAKFLGIKTLGICEKNTLAGAMPFQIACNKNGVTPVLGMTASVKLGSEFNPIDIKFYVKDEDGWESLLMIHKQISIVNSGYIYEKDLLIYNKGLICIIDPKSFEFDQLRVNKYKKYFDCYYQLDTVEYSKNDRDKWYLENLKKFVSSSILEPALILDSYYIDKDEFKTKKILNSISNKFEYDSVDQYFKNLDDIFEQLSVLFNENDSRIYDIFSLALQNVNLIASECKFNVNLKERHLPSYIMNSDEKERFETNEDLFWHLIEQGFEERVPKDKQDLYMERIQMEYEVIKLGNVLDYFLILYDVVRYCRENSILTGHARGSAAGALTSFLLKITQVDPIRWNLLFERFLNPGRVQKSLPDIDIDVQTQHRDEVKNYLRTKYGYDQFCYIGTYTTLQLKGAFKELCRLNNVSFSDANYLTSILDFEETPEGEFVDLFKNAVTKSRLKKFILENVDLVNEIRLILGSPKSPSIHACATLTVPSDKQIYNYIPLRWAEKGEDEKILVSEWEGDELADSGFLKNDILVIEQLDKYRFCLDLIKKTVGDEIDIYNLPLEDESVFELFRKGYCSDIFQFGSKSLTNYLKELQPDNIDELIDATALYRPGPIRVNSHNEYILRKFGEKSIDYSYGLKDVTATTKGLLIYQEQIMQACRVLGNFSLVDADDIRKSIVKKNKDIIKSYKDQFIKGALSNGCPEDEAEEIWHELEVHGEYSFNLSHAASYTLISYVGQWIKYHYPIQFWTTALQFSKNEEEVSSYINEINKLESIKIIPPDVNNSGKIFQTKYDKGEIYWSLSNIKFCGEVAVNCIISERDKNGNFYSFDEFYNRVEKSKVNKRIIINLILSGAFDEIENIKNVCDRIKLVRRYYEISLNKDVNKDEILINQYNNREYFWILRQKQLTGYGFIDYGKMFKYLSTLSSYKSKFVDSSDFFEERNEDNYVVVSGIITAINQRTNKKGEYCQLELDSNNEAIYITIWSEQFSQVKKDLIGHEGDIVFVYGLCKFDTYKSTQVVYSDEKFSLEIIK